jgi:hypothetical protein
VARKHHVVSAGYLRFFGLERRPSKYVVRLLSKDIKVNEVVPVEKILWQRGMHTAVVNGLEDDALEDEFAAIERRVLPIISRIIAGEYEPGWAGAVKALMALHLARSYRYQEMFNRTVDEYFGDPLKGMSVDRLTRAFRKQYGRGPADGELDSLVRDYIERWRSSNAFYVAQSGEAFNKAFAMFEDKQIELVKVRPPAPHLLTGDAPLVVAAGNNWRRVRVAIGDADLVYMPLSPTVAASVITGDEPRVGVISKPSAARRLNSTMWRNCDRWIVAHPKTDWKKSIGRG